MKKLTLFLLSLSMVSGSVFANGDVPAAEANEEVSSCCCTKFLNDTWEGTKNNKCKLAATAFVLGAVAATYKHVKSCTCSSDTNCCAEACDQGCHCAKSCEKACA
jgi:hypothetical protein